VSGAGHSRCIDAPYSRLPLGLRRIIHRARLRVRAGHLTQADWASRPASDADHYWRSIDQPYRRTLIEQLHAFGPPRSLLELGSHSGPNLRLAARAFPGARLSGIEVNAPVVERARQLLREDGLERVQLTAGPVADVLPRLADDSEDVLFSCFALAYVPPTELAAVLSDAVRIARLGLVLLEPQARAGQRAGLMRETAGWRHDYAATLAHVGVEGQAIRIVDLPQAHPSLNGCLLAALRGSLGAGQDASAQELPASDR
jgi:hypothetical protein